MCQTLINFYPGPSKIYPQISVYCQEACASGILSQNHRSESFMRLLQDCIEIFKQKLNIPSYYEVFFTSSATECWEIIAQSFVTSESFHLYSGAFGQKWFEYTQKIHPLSHGQWFDFQAKIKECSIPESAEILCVTQNETSNTSQLDLNIFHPLPSEKLIAIDVTSSLGGVELDWKKGDIWLASAQKCLGLPSGLGMMVCSPKAIQKAIQTNERNHYNSFLFIRENFIRYQTHYTPNILGIYLLKRVMEQVEYIQKISDRIIQRALDIYDFIENETNLELLVHKHECRSMTVIGVSGSKEKIQEIKQKAAKKNIILGNGYGKWQDISFRIANFPAIDDNEFDQLKQLLQQ